MYKKIALTALFALVISFIGGHLVSAEENAAQQQVAKLREAISLTNLTNGLNLSEVQLRQIVPVLKEYQEVYKTFKQQQDVRAEQMAKAFNDLKDALQSGGPFLRPSVENQASKLDSQESKANEEFNLKLIPFQTKIENILTEAQKTVLEEFSACLLPPADQKNPVRVGQINANEHALNIIKKIRSVPENDYRELRNTILQNYFFTFEDKHGKLTEAEKEQEKNRLFGLADKVRVMSDAEFELNKNALADEFIIRNKAEELEKQLKDLLHYRTKTKKGLNKVGHYFLNPQMLGILEAKLANLKNFSPLPPADMDNIKATPGEPNNTPKKQ